MLVLRMQCYFNYLLQLCVCVCLFSRLLHAIVVTCYGCCYDRSYPSPSEHCRLSRSVTPIDRPWNILRWSSSFPHRIRFHLTKKPFNEADSAKNVPRGCHATDRYLVTRARNRSSAFRREWEFLGALRSTENARVSPDMREWGFSDNYSSSYADKRRRLCKKKNGRKR